jgi:hypothetical protein
MRCCSMCRRNARLVLAVALAAAILVPAAGAATCPRSSIKDKLTGADLAFVGMVTAVTPVASAGGIPLDDYRFKVLHPVKGQVGRVVTLRAAKLVDLDLQEVKAGLKVPIGVLASRESGRLVTSSCSLVDPGSLMGAADEPKGGLIKVGVGVILLGIVLAYSLRRLKKRRQVPPLRPVE